jgi:hypothetical protein
VTPPQSDVAGVVAGLTVARARALAIFPASETTLDHGLAVANLINMGLMDYGPRWIVFGEKVLRLTRKGRAARQMILAASQRTTGDKK